MKSAEVEAARGHLNRAVDLAGGTQQGLSAAVLKYAKKKCSQRSISSWLNGRQDRVTDAPVLIGAEYCLPIETTTKELLKIAGKTDKEIEDQAVFSWQLRPDIYPPPS